METIFREKLVEVVAGDPPRNARKLFAHQITVAIADPSQPRVNLPDAAAGAYQVGELLVAGAANGHARAVVKGDVEGLDVVDRFAAEKAMHTAAVVADHAAERAA